MYGGAREWFASNLNIHTPSEHTVNGRRKDMEMQIVHYPYEHTVVGDAD